MWNRSTHHETDAARSRIAGPGPSSDVSRSRDLRGRHARRERWVAITGARTAVVLADGTGSFEANLEPGDYAVTATTDHGYRYVETMHVPDVTASLVLSRECTVVSGRVKGASAARRINAVRISKFNGDTFFGHIGSDGHFALCVPEAHYTIQLDGPFLSLPVDADVASNPVAVEVVGIAASEVKQPPREVSPLTANLDGLVADILRSDARVIGMGEATHGTAEFVSSRAALTFELIRRAELELILFEFDAVLSTAIDDYVMGGAIDLPKAVAALGFWITDTYELLGFFRELRAYNATARRKVHVWGVDVQDHKPPVAVLLANERALALTAADKALLAEVGKTFRVASEPIKAQRAELDALLARLAKHPAHTAAELRIAVASGR